MNSCSESKHVETKFNMILNAITLKFFLIFIKCCHKGRVTMSTFANYCGL